MAQAVTIAGPGDRRGSAKSGPEAETVTTGTMSSIDAKRGVHGGVRRVYRFTPGS